MAMQYLVRNEVQTAVTFTAESGALKHIKILNDHGVDCFLMVIDESGRVVHERDFFWVDDTPCPISVPFLTP